MPTVTQKAPMTGVKCTVTVIADPAEACSVGTLCAWVDGIATRLSCFQLIAIVEEVLVIPVDHPDAPPELQNKDSQYYPGDPEEGIRPRIVIAAHITGGPNGEGACGHEFGHHVMETCREWFANGFRDSYVGSTPAPGGREFITWVTSKAGW